MLLAGGCGSSSEPTTKVIPHSTKTYKLVGVVRKVERDSGSVTIKHEEIPGFMGAMTMPFTLKKNDLLDDVRVGDEVEGSLRVEFEQDKVQDYELTDLVVTRPAPPPKLTLNLSGKNGESPRVSKALEPGEIVPDFTFTAQDGKTQKLSDLRGKVVVLTFIYTRCPLPDFCPAMDRKFAELASKVEAVSGRAERVRLLSMSFDPEHDTPAVLREHAKVQGARPPLWTFAVATHPELSKIMMPLGLIYGPTGKEIAHNLTTALIDQEGRLVRLESGKAWKSADLMKTIAELLKTVSPAERNSVESRN